MTPEQFNEKVSEFMGHQMDGPPLAYFEILMPGCSRGQPYKQIWRFEYIMFWAFGKTEAECWQKLWDFLKPGMESLHHGQGALLFWRARPEIQTVPEDHPASGLGPLRLRCRLAVPGLDFEPAREHPEYQFPERPVIL